MSLKEVAKAMDLKEKKTFRLMRSLFKKDQIKMKRTEDGVRRYVPNTE
ncbi:MAG: hypothetical protein PVJ38_08360 [Candidatus Bathyarchaeota archaeon]